MSTAILISGQLRTFAKCWPTQRWHVLRHFADPHFFITVQFDQAEIIAELVKEYGRDRVHYDPRTDPDLSADLTPELARAYHQAPYTNAAPAHQLLLQHWYQAACWRQFQDKVLSLGFGVDQFDTIIRLRADMYFHDFDPPPRTGTTVFNRCYVPRWGGFGGINDRFAVMGYEAAAAYFTLYDNIPTLLAKGCPFHPESLLKAQLEYHSVAIHRMDTTFSTERLNGERRWWMQEVLPHELRAA